MKNKVTRCVINFVIHCNKFRHAILCNAAKKIQMEIVMSYNFIVIKTSIDLHFHQETSNTVHLVEIVMSNILVISFAVCLKKA